MNRFTRSLLFTAPFFAYAGFAAKTYINYEHEAKPAKPPVGTSPKTVATSVPTIVPASDNWDIIGATASEIVTAKSIIAQFQAGNYGKALQAVEQELNQSSIGQQYSTAYKQWLKEQLPTVLLSQGWLLLKQGQCEEAMTLLARAENLRAGPDATKGLAVCFHKLHDVPSAADKFAAYLAVKPNDWDAQLLYVDALESDQRFGEAFSILEKITKDPPKMDDETWKELLRRRDRMAAKSRESFRQATTGSRHFVVIFRSEEHRDLAAYVTEVLERSHDDFATSLGTVTLNNPVEVALYPSQEFGRLAGGPAWADGLFDGRIRIPVPTALDNSPAARARLTRVIRHELLHALLAIQSDHRALPTWFNEGLAQTVECDSSRCAFDSFPPTPGNLLNADAFETAFTHLSAAGANQAYLQSRYLVGILFRDYGEEGVRKLIEGLSSQGNTSSDGVLKPLGITFKAFLDNANESWKQRLTLHP